MPICPSGHDSTTSDYCDQCGAKMDGPAPSAAPPPTAPMPTAAPAPGPGGALVCPHCQSAYGPSDKFCEVCGYDFATGNLPAPPELVPLQPLDPPLVSPVHTAAAGPDPAEEEEEEEVAPTAPTARSGPTNRPAVQAWEAVVAADRSYYDREAGDEVAFPVGAPERVFALAGDRVLIGRRSVSRGITPDIDLSGAPEDTGISRAHAMLVREPDGSWALVDPGSTNGTFLNDGIDPIPQNDPRPVADGDRIYIGAWTRITLHRRS